MRIPEQSAFEHEDPQREESLRDFLQDLEYPNEQSPDQEKILESTDEALRRFPDAHRLIAWRLLSVGYGFYVAENLEKFDGVDRKAIARQLIADDNVQILVENLEKFDGVDQGALFWHVFGDGLPGDNLEFLLSNLGKFEQLDHNAVFQRLSESRRTNDPRFSVRYTRYIKICLENGVKFNHDTCQALIDLRKSSLVANNLEKFEGVDHKEVVRSLMRSNDFGSVVHSLEKFDGVDHGKIAQWLMEHNQFGILANNLEKFEGVDRKKIADWLMENKQYSCIANNLEKFEGVDHDNLITCLLTGSSDDLSVLLNNLEKFEGVDYNDLAKRIIHQRRISILRGRGRLVKFGLLDKSVSDLLIESNEPVLVLENLDSFEQVDFEALLEKLILINPATLLQNIEKFEGVDHSEIAKQIIDASDYGSEHVAGHLYKLRGLDAEVAEKLIANGRLQNVIDNLDKFSGLDKNRLVRLALKGDGADVLAINSEKFSFDDKTWNEIQSSLGIRSEKLLLKGWIEKCQGTEREFVNSIKRIKELLEEMPGAAEELVGPTVFSQGVGAFRSISVFARLHRFGAIQSQGDINILKQIVTSYGVKAIDILNFICDGLVGERDDNEEFQRYEIIEVPLSRNSYLLEFFSEFPAISEIYTKYSKIRGELSADEQPEEIRALRRYVEKKRREIIVGRLNKDDLEDPEYLGLIYHAFPPAITLDREQYRQLALYREDRQDDIPKEWGDLENTRCELPIGRFQVRQGEAIDTGAWRMIQEIVKTENKKDISDVAAGQDSPEQAEVIHFSGPQIAELGKDLISGLANQRSFRKNRKSLLSTVHQLHCFVNKTKLTADLTTRDGLVQTKEYVGDHMRDTIDIALRAFHDSDSETYEESVRKAMEVKISPKAKKAISKNVISILKSLGLNHQETNGKIKSIFAKYNVQVEGDILSLAIEEVQGANNDEEATKNLTGWLTGILGQAEQQRKSGKLSSEISRRLLGDEHKQILT